MICLCFISGSIFKSGGNYIPIKRRKGDDDQGLVEYKYPLINIFNNYTRRPGYYDPELVECIISPPTTRK